MIRAAGDLAREEGVPFAEARHVFAARPLARSLENQIADKQIEIKKEYKIEHVSELYIELYKKVILSQ